MSKHSNFPCTFTVCLVLGCPFSIKRLMIQNPSSLKHSQHKT